MKRCSKCGVEKEPDGFYRRRARGVDARRSECIECVQSASAAYGESHREEVRQNARDYRAANPGAVRAAQGSWMADNRESSRLYSKEYRSSHRETVNANTALWKKENPDKNAEHASRYKARKIGATPKWANRFFVQEAYALARLRTATLGFPWQVDHIVPLKSASVCGLHVEYNLQVIPAKLNNEKHNSHWPDMP